MKRFAFTALLAVSLTGAFAQSNPSISQRAADYTRSLAPHIGLDDARQLQVKKLAVKPIVLDYDQTARRLAVVDRSFLVWLQHQDRADLLATIGLGEL